MRSIVTGGAGFLGSHLCDYLLAQGHEVVCIDNLITGNTDNIAHLFGNEKFSFIKHDVTHEMFLAGKVDFVLHFASPASPVDYLKYPIQTLKVGSLGTHKALGLAKHKGARFLLASTSEIYGDPLVHPQREDYWGNVNPIGFRGVYDEAKRFAEAMTMAYHRYHKLDTRIVRIFNTYGPRMRLNDGRALPTFVSQVLHGEKITVYGNGQQTRSFCFVSDLIRGIYKLLMSDEALPVNIGNPDEVTMYQAAQEVLELSRELGMPGAERSEVTLVPMPDENADDPKVRKPDITKARTILGWQPEVSRRDGFRITIEHFMKKGNGG
ncbi:MAG TPA: UDP-glucuronic acid decarboxylase family protein [Planctomycetota bacterium]|nr:UDP-glucuronic acid decarboxylase family protein [Planctomycetota bacterium]